MTTIVTRAGKGSPLTHTEVDTNFTNLNTNKLETAAIPLGTLAAPSISFLSDANTGIYSPAADTVAFVTAGSNRVHITSGGLVGIGTSSPGTKLHVYGANFPVELKIQSGDTQPTVSFYSDAVQAPTRNWAISSSFSNYGDLCFQQSNALGGNPLTAGTTRFMLNAAGNVGIGSTTPLSNFVVSNSGAEGIELVVNQPDGANTVRYFNYNRSSATYQNVAYLAASHQWRIQNDEKARLDSSGRLLIGTSSAFGGSKTEINSGTDTSAIRINDANHDGSGSTFLYPVAAYYARTQGNVRSANPLDTGGATAAIVFTDEPGNATYVENLRSSSIRFYTGANSVPSFANVTPTERMRITNAGHILFGTTDADAGIGGTPSGAAIGSFKVGAGEGFRVSSTGAHYWNMANDGSIHIFRRNGTNVGSIAVSSGATAYNTTSDYRLKENVAEVTDGITRLLQLTPSRFNFIADPAKTVDGFLAHEVQTVVPEAITGEKDAVDDDGNPVYQGIDQSKLVPLLTAALQEAIAKIESLEARLTAAGL